MTADGGIVMSMYLMTYAAVGVVLVFLLVRRALRYTPTANDPGPVSEQWLSDQKRLGDESSR